MNFNRPQIKKTRSPDCVVNNEGVKFAYLQTSVTTTGGGTYITRALDARNKTGADVIVFMIPQSPNALKTIERIKRGRDDLASAVKPLLLPFKIVAVISEHQSNLEHFFKDARWFDVRA